MNKKKRKILLEILDVILFLKLTCIKTTKFKKNYYVLNIINKLFDNLEISVM